MKGLRIAISVYLYRLTEAVNQPFMLKSMTGFGKANFEDEKTSILVEAKALNSKYLDANIKFPRSFSHKEIEIKNLLTQRLERGKVSLAITYVSNADAEPKVKYNAELFKRYYEEQKALAVAVGADEKDLYRLAIQSPEVITNLEDDSLSDQEWAKVTQCMNDALDACIEYRTREGQALAAALVKDAHSIGEMLEKVKEREPERIVKIKERIRQHMHEFVESEQFDKNRYEQELIYYIEKLDINEEMVRLKAHINYFLEVIESSPAAVGKKLGFISQEMGREINTIGSKANDAQIQRFVIKMKEDLEKIKEQVLNIL